MFIKKLCCVVINERGLLIEFCVGLLIHISLRSRLSGNIFWAFRVDFYSSCFGRTSIRGKFYEVSKKVFWLNLNSETSRNLMKFHATNNKASNGAFQCMMSNHRVGRIRPLGMQNPTTFLIQGKIFMSHKAVQGFVTETRMSFSSMMCFKNYQGDH